MVDSLLLMFSNPDAIGCGSELREIAELKDVIWSWRQ